MSKVVDQRVVEMQFDNSHFERNVSTTMSTLDKLKQRLNLSGASKGLEDIGSAARKVDLSGVGNAADTVGLKFNAMYTIADQALRNITNAAMRYGNQIVSALTIDPIKTGFSEYETQINAVQTILANTESKGTTLDDVNKALDELNAYADKTIYNFTEMTRNIGTFTAAGTDLETSVKAIQGIANLAAVSGSTSQQASTAMYQLSQALSSGTVKLMDWNSVVNAGMGGQVFQDALKETARVHGVAIDQMIESEGSFRETLKDGWLTAEILTETLEKFTLTTEGLTEAEIEANRQMLRSKGYTDEQIESIFKLGNTATNAATKVKTFSQLWDTLKEAAQSGWTQTWELIIGDFEEAKSLLTGISNYIGGFIDSMSKWRNNLLAGALGNPFEGIAEKIKSVTGATDAVKKAVEGATGNLEYFQDIVNKVWNGDFNNRGDNPDRFDLLRNAGYNPNVVQELVNLGHGYKLTLEDVEAAQKKYGVSSEEATKANAALVESLAGLSDEQLKNLGFTEDEIKAFRELEKQCDKAGITIEEFLKDTSQLDGRTLLINSFKNAGLGLVSVFKALKDAWVEIFPPPTSEQLYNVIAGLHKFSLSLRMSDETADNLKRTFKGVFALFDILTTLLGGGFKLAFNAVRAILEVFDLNILDVTANIGDAIVAFRDWLDSVLDFNKIFEKIAPQLKAAATGVKDWINGLKETDNVPKYILDGIVSLFKNGAKLIGDAGKAIGNTLLDALRSIPGMSGWIDKLSAALGKLGEFLSAGRTGVLDWLMGLQEAENVPKYIIETLVEGLKKGGAAVLKGVKYLGGLIIDGLKNIPALGDWFQNMPNIGNWFKQFSKIGDWFASLKDSDNIPRDIILGLANGIRNGADIVFDAIIALAKGIIETVCNVLGIHSPSREFFDIGTNIVQGLINGVKSVLSGLWELFSTIGSKLIEYIKEIDFGTLLAGALTGGMIISGLKFADALQSFAAPLKGLGDMFEEFGDAAKAMSKGVKNYLNSKALLNMAIAIGVLVAAVFALTLVKPDRLWTAVGALGALAGVVAVLGGVAIAINKLGDFKTVAITLLTITGTIAILAIALKQLSEIESENASSAVGLLVGTLVSMLAVVAILGLLGKRNLIGKVDGVGALLIKMSVALLLMVGVVKIASKMDSSTLGKGIGVVAAIEVLFIAIIAVSKLAGEHASKAGGMLLKMSIAIGIMLLVVKMASWMKESTLKKGIGVVAAIEVLFIAIIAVSKLAGEHASKAGGMLLKMSIAILLLLGVVKLASMISKEEVNRASGTIALIGGMFAVFMLLTKKTNKNVDKMGTMLLKVSVAILLLVGVMALLSLFKPSDLVKSLAAIIVLEGCFAGLIAVTKVAKGTKGMQKTLTMLVVAIGVLAVALVALSFLEPGRVAVAAAAISAVAGVFAGLIAVTKVAKNTKQMRTMLLEMIGIVAVLAGIIALLSLLDPISVLTVSGALAIMLTSFAGALFIMGAAGKISTTVSKQLVPMTLVIAGLALILGIMSTLKVEASIKSAIALGVLLNTLATALLIMGKAGKISSTVSKQLGAITLVVAGLALILGIMSALNVEASIPTAIALGVLLNALAAALVIMGAAGRISTTVSAQLFPMLAVVAGLALILGIMSALNVEASIPTAIALGVLLNALASALLIMSLAGNISTTVSAQLFPMLAVVAGLALIVGLLEAFDVAPSIETALALSTLLLGFSGALAILSVIGPAASASYSAMGALAALIGGFGAVIAAFGALSYIDGFDELMTNGAETLSKLAYAIGDFVGSLIAGFGEGVTSSLPEIGANLAGFADAVSSINENSVNGVKALSEALLALTGASVLDALASLLTFGEGGLAGITKQLPTVAEGIVGFTSTLQEAGFTEDSVAIAEAAANALSKLAAVQIENSGGILGFIMGNNDLDTFAASLPTVARGLIGFLTPFAETPLDQTAINTASNAATMLGALASVQIENSGGVLGFIMGENDLDAFASRLPTVAQGLIGFLTPFAEKPIDQTAIDTASNAATMLSTLANVDIPNSGGVLGFIMGENDIDTFAARLPKVAESLVGFLTPFAETPLDQTAIDTASNAASMLSTLANVDIPNSGGVLGFIMGENDIDTFAGKLPEAGKGIAGFVSALKNGGMTAGDEELVKVAISAIEALANAANNIDGTNWFEKLIGEENGLVTLGDALRDFSGPFSEFCNNVKGINIEAVSTATSAIASLTVVAQKIQAGGFSSTCLTDFGKDVQELGHKLSQYSVWIGTVDSGKIIDVNEVLYDFINVAKNLGTVNTSSIYNLSSVIENMGTKLLSFYKSIKDISTQDVSAALTQLNQLVAWAKNIGTLNAAPFASFADSLEKVAKTGVSGFVRAFRDSKAVVAGAGRTMVEYLVDAVTSKAATITDAFRKPLSNAVTAIQGMFASFSLAGGFIVTGFASGITANTFRAEAAATAMAQAALNAARKLLKIKSPSRAFYKVGDYAGMGFVNALGDYETKSYNVAGRMADASLRGMNKAIAKITDVFNTDLDSQPTIRPVLDLSEVESGVGRIGGMFGTQTLAVDTHTVGAVSALMSQRSQNGVNGDVVSAIDKLRGELGNSRGDTYTINGITYDDGSNITDAVRTIVRAARIERRV